MAKNHNLIEPPAPLTRTEAIELCHEALSHDLSALLLIDSSEQDVNDVLQDDTVWSQAWGKSGSGAGYTTLHRLAVQSGRLNAD